MNNENVFHRGDVYVAYLGGTFGCTGRDIRPVMIMQNDGGEHSNPAVAIIPMGMDSKGIDPKAHVRLDGRKYTFLRTSTVALCDFPNIVNKRNLFEYLGRIDREDIKRISATITDCMGFEMPMAADAP